MDKALFENYLLYKNSYELGFSSKNLFKSPNILSENIIFVLSLLQLFEKGHEKKIKSQSSNIT